MSAAIQTVARNESQPVGEWGCTPTPNYASLHDAPLARLGSIATSVVLEAGDELFEQDDPVTYCYQIVSGCVRTVRLMEDGRRQIGGFLMPGDVLGFDARGRHDYAAQAVSGTVLNRYPVHAVMNRAERDAGFAMWLWRTAAGQLHRSREHAVLLGRMTATERVARFLCDMQARGGQAAGQWVTLPMQRADIADYLGLTVETVSRTLTQLRRARAIDIQPGKVIVRSQRALTEMAADSMPDEEVAMPLAAGGAAAAGLAHGRFSDTVHAPAP